MMSTPSAPGTSRFKGAKVTKKVKFMNDEIEIHKLTVAQVLEIQELAKNNEEKEDDNKGITILYTVVRSGTVDLRDFSDEELNDFPMDELSKLSNEIMKHSGLNTGKTA